MLTVIPPMYPITKFGKSNTGTLFSKYGSKYGNILHFTKYGINDEFMISFSLSLAHTAIAELEKRLKPQNRKVTVITQNIDQLHYAAGSENVIELHGSLFHTRCTKCGDIRKNRDSPIVPALKDKG